MSAQSLKPGWKMVKFGDIAQNVAVRVDPADAKTDVYVGLEHLDPSTIHLRQWGHPTDVTGQKLAFKKGDVIFGRRRAYQRKLAVAEFDGICSAHAMVVRAKPKMILPEFLPFFLQSDMFMERAIEISVGSLSPTINWKTLKVQEFPLPPLDEQKRIAEILWTADESIERWIAVARNLEITGKMLRTNLIHNSAFPRERLSDVCVLKGGSTFKPAFQGKKAGQYPFIKVSDMNSAGNEEFITVAENYVDENDIRQMKTTVFPKGAVVFAKVGAALLLNRRRMLVAETCIDNNMMAAIPDNEKLTTEFLYLFMLDVDFRNYVQEGALPSINNKIVGEITIPIPPINDQKDIVFKHRAVMSGFSEADKNISLTRELVLSLLTDFLEGAAHV